MSLRFVDADWRHRKIYGFRQKADIHVHYFFFDFAKALPEYFRDDRQSYHFCNFNNKVMYMIIRFGGLHDCILPIAHAMRIF